MSWAKINFLAPNLTWNVVPDCFSLPFQSGTFPMKITKSRTEIWEFKIPKFQMFTLPLCLPFISFYICVLIFWLPKEQNFTKISRNHSLKSKFSFFSNFLFLKKFMTYCLIAIINGKKWCNKIYIFALNITPMLNEIESFVNPDRNQLICPWICQKKSAKNEEKQIRKT